MKAIEQYFHVVLFIMLYKVVLTFQSVDETLACDNSNESHANLLLFITLYKPARDNEKLIMMMNDEDGDDCKVVLILSLWM